MRDYLRESKLDWQSSTAHLRSDSFKWKWSHSVVPDSLWPHGLRSLPGSSVHGIFQARILEWVAISFSRRSSWPRDWTLVFHIVDRSFTVWNIREVRCESWTIKLDWALKNWCFWTMVLENPLKNPLGCKEIQPVNPKRNQSWIYFGRTSAKAEAPILWPPDAKSQLIRKDSDPGKDSRQEEKGTKEDEMVGWHHWFHGNEFEQILGDGEGEGSLACCSSMGLQSQIWLSDWETIFV